MELNIEQFLSQLTTQFLGRNYDYLWMRTMLEQASSTHISGSTLITGSSHALNGMKESCWVNAFNCSMHSQDLYYDFLCARRVLERAGKDRFVRCFIVLGYYIAFQDLSLSTYARQYLIPQIYYPIFHDVHNWEIPPVDDPWAGTDGIPDTLKKHCEQSAIQMILEQGTYYSQFRPRRSYFDLKGKQWKDLSMEQKHRLAEIRAGDHNKIFRHKSSYNENKQILKDYVHFLNLNHVLPIVVIPPFTPEYNRYTLPEMKDAVVEMLDAVPEDVHYVNFNQGCMFGPSDFMDTDHLSAEGAEKVSSILVEMFGP
ncbi:MAG: hypothetical protein HFH26_03235 [Clostridiaceae bacterium]|nr:hypothetical protein [Clostridiaceae bacterium]